MISNLFDKIFLKKSLHEVAGRQDVARGRRKKSTAPGVLSFWHCFKVLVRKSYEALRAFTRPGPCLDRQNRRDDLTVGILTPADYIDGPLVGIDIKSYWARRCRAHKLYLDGHKFMPAAGQQGGNAEKPGRN